MDGNESVSSNHEGDENALKKEKITVKLCGQDGGYIMYKVKRNVKIGRLLDAYAGDTGMNKGDLRLIYKGKVLDGSQTPFSLGLEGGAEIEVVASQSGGTQQN